MKQLCHGGAGHLRQSVAGCLHAAATVQGRHTGGEEKKRESEWWTAALMAIRPVGVWRTVLGGFHRDTTERQGLASKLTVL